jgi:glutamine synthetase
MELRSPDPSLNPYLSFALIIAAGLDGIENKADLPPAIDADLYTADEQITKGLELLPDSLNKAIFLAENSDFVKNITGEELLSKYLSVKKSEFNDFINVADKEKFYTERYFNII